MNKFLTFKSFSIIFILFLVLEIVCDLTLDSRWGVYLTKPILMPLLIIWAKMASNRQNEVIKLLYTSLFFSMLGDIFLMFHTEIFFLFGLSSFLIAHLLYIWMFVKEISTGNVVNMNQKLLRGLPFVVFYVIFMSIAIPYIVEIDSAMLAPVMIYALTICVMGYIASLRSRAVSPTSYAWVLLGALAFTISDTCIAINKFINPLPYPTIPIMLLYGIGQLLITGGVLYENNKVENFA